MRRLDDSTVMPVIPLFIIYFYYWMKDKRVRSEGIIYSFIVTFMALFAYAILYPSFKAIISMSLPGMGDVEATVILVIPVAIFLSILWGVTWLIQPRKA